MNQSLATRQTNSIETGQGNIVQSLPHWLQYLIGAYPSSKTTPAQFMVMEDQFTDYDAVVLVAAAREFVRSDKRTYKDNPGGFPSVGEFRPAVQQTAAKQEPPIIDLTAIRTSLRLRRKGLLELWHRDEVEPGDLLALADEMQSAGMIHAAVSLRGRVRE